MGIDFMHRVCVPIKETPGSLTLSITWGYSEKMIVHKPSVYSAAVSAGNGQILSHSLRRRQLQNCLGSDIFPPEWWDNQIRCLSSFAALSYDIPRQLMQNVKALVICFKKYLNIIMLHIQLALKQCICT